MNIIIVNDFATVNGGASQIAFQTAMLLKEHGHRVIFFSAVPPIAKELQEKGIEVICLGQYDILHDPNRLRAAISGLWNKSAAIEMRKLLNGFSTEDTVVHIHGLSKSLTTSVVRVAHNMNFKIIYHLHDYGVACPNLGFFDYQKQKICHKRAMGLECVCTNCDSRSYPQKIWRICRQIVQLKIGGLPDYIDGFIYISQFSFEILKRYIPDSKKCFYLRNPLAVTKRPRVKVEDNSKFLFVGRLTPEKNPVLLARVAKKIGAPVLFVGEGSEKERVKSIYPKAEMAGWVDHGKLYEYMAQARALVFPSILGETQGLSAFEAQAYGVPVIVSDECAAKEAIIHGRTGWMFRNNSLHDLERFMLAIIDDDVAANLGNEAYNSFWDSGRENEKYIDSLSDIYHQVLALNR